MDNSETQNPCLPYSIYNNPLPSPLSPLPFPLTQAGEFTRGNLFFHALEDDSGDDATPQSTDTRPLIARLLKDAAVVRLLQVCDSDGSNLYTRSDMCSVSWSVH